METSSFERRLAGYALAAGSVLLGAGSIEAGIVSSGPLDINLPVEVDPIPYFIDFDNDGFDDFVIVNAFDSSGDSFSSLTSASDAIIAEDIDGYGFAVPLSVGNLITPYNQTKEGGKLTLDTVPPPSGFSPSPWAPGTDAFIGFTFLGDVELFSGWVEVAVETDYSLTIKGWAYNDEDGQGILAGQLVGVQVPEPSSIALLAAGAAGVSAFTALKRRSSKSAS